MSKYIKPITGNEDMKSRFLEMWDDGNEDRMFALGVNSCVIRDTDELVAAMCVHIIDIPIIEYRRIADLIPDFEKNIQHYYGEETIEITKAIELINRIIREYNRINSEKPN